MPELPEVEVVRAGLHPAVTGARVVGAEVMDPRALKRHAPLVGDDDEGGHGVTMSTTAGIARAADFERRITGVMLDAPVRRGKFLWIPIAGFETKTALLAHLGMSGQLLLRTHDADDDRHVRVRLWIHHTAHGELRLDFADQRLFGSLAIDSLEVTPDGAPGGHAGAELLQPGTSTSSAARLIPTQAQHIARDPLDPVFDAHAWVAMLRRRTAPVKSLLLNQELASGIGNIYADEALWRARVHPLTPGARLSVRKGNALVAALEQVFGQALREGGTSFDTQYVNVNGEAGYFAHSLHAYGRTDQPCPRCGTPIKRITFANRGSHFCPRCQRKQ